LSENEIGIFTNFKRAGEHFRREVLIVHDLSFVLTPEFHAADRIADYVKRIFCDVKSVDRVVCVSEATKNDVIKYFGVHDSRVTVSHLGVLFNESLRDSDIRAELNRIGLHGDYFLQLGTIEPRKNVDVVLRLIKQFPHWLESYKFVFAGKNGWGRSFEEIKEVHDIKDKQVIHYDYINEYTKECLLRGAKALLFPSWFEGFGLPVIEAMAAGTLVVGSKSSSVVEVGGQAMFGFDPNSPTSLNQALLKVVNLTERERQGAIAAGTRHAAQFTWERFADGVLASARHSGERLRWTRALSPEGGPTRALGSR
jgi:alpha-1,3-rhamnosyl/mannosyltransferase